MAIATLLDPVEVKERVVETLIAHGYFKTKNDDKVVDDTRLKVDVYEAVKKKVAREREDIVKSSLSNGELYALILPEAPGTNVKQLPGLSDMDRAIRTSLMRKVWGYTQPKRTGFIQKRLGTEKTKFILCRTLSTRGLDNAEVCFVTDNSDLIMSESVLPQIENLVQKADDLRLHTEMVTNRRPELKGPIAKELGVGVRRIEASLSQAESDAGAAPLELNA